MKSNRWITLSLVLLVTSFAAADLTPVTAKSKLAHVTLYRSQALVVREVEVPATTGEMALVVEGLPAAIDPSSLFASSTDLKIRSVRYLTEYVTKKLPPTKSRRSKPSSKRSPSRKPPSPRAASCSSARKPTSSRSKSNTSISSARRRRPPPPAARRLALISRRSPK